MVTLPFVLLLLDYWPLDRFAQATTEGRLLQRAGTLALEKLPLLAMAAAVSVITFLLQQGGAMNSFETAPVATRLLNATGTYGTYIAQTFWPTGLAAFYPLAPEPVLLRQAIFGGALVAAGTLAALAFARRLPYLSVGWFWYLGTLLPVIGLIQVGAQAHADRYTYIPHIGLLVVLVWGLGDAVARWRLPRTVPIAVAGVILPALMLCSWFQVGHWRDSETLWLRSLKVAGSSVKAHYNLGMVYVRGNRIPEAADHFAEAARLSPSLDRAHNNLGNTLATLGRYPEAISEWIVTLRLNPNHPSARQNLNIVITFLMDEGRTEEAETAKALLAELDLPANNPATP